MPELATVEEIRFGQDVIKLGWDISQNILKGLAQKRGLEFIDNGCECVVVGQKGYEHKVTAFKYSEVNKDKMRTIFYTERILSVLFPHNFPHFYSVFYGNPKAGLPGGSIRQRIIGPNKENLAPPQFQSLVKYRFETALEKLKELEIPVRFDMSVFNFAVGSDGGEYYLDTPVFDPDLPLDKNSILNYMKKDIEHYSEYDMRLVTKSIDRINKIR